MNKAEHVYDPEFLVRAAPHTLAEWASAGTGNEWKAARHLAYISREVVLGIAQGNARIIVNIGPGRGKSSLISKWMPIWFLETFPQKRTIVCSYGASLAEYWGAEVRNEFQSNPKLRVKLRQDSTAVAQWRTQQGGGMKAAGTSGDILGFRFDCLPAGTKIKTEAGDIDISELVNLKPMPRVLSFNHKTCESEYKNILAAAQSKSSDIYKITTYGSRSFECTGNHKIYSTTRGYVNACDLRINESLVCLDGEDEIFVKFKTGEQNLTVYDIQVQGNKNFYLANGVLVHNCGIIDDPIKDHQEAHSPVSREALKRWFESTFMTRAEPNASIIILMHRWHPDDLCGHLIKNHPDSWKVLKFPEIAGPNDILGRKEGEVLWPERWPIENALRVRKENPTVFQSMYQQEPLLENNDRAYYKFTQAGNIVEDKKIYPDTTQPLCLALDFNVNPGMHGLIGQVDNQNDMIVVHDELYGDRWRTEDLMKEFFRWFGDWPDQNRQVAFPFPMLHIYGDRSGRNANTVTSQTDYGLIIKMLNEHNPPIPHRMYVPMSNPPIKDRVLTVNEALCDGDGKVHVLVHPRCAKLVTDFSSQPGDEDGMPDKSNQLLGHAGDAFGYMCVWVRPLRFMQFTAQKVLY